MKIKSRLSPFFLALQINGVFLVTFFLENLLSGYITIILSLMTLIFAVIDSPTNKKRYINFKNVIILLLLLVYISLTIFWSPNKTYGLFKINGLLINVLIPIISIGIMYEKGLLDTKFLGYIAFFSVTAVLLNIIVNGKIGFNERYSIKGTNVIWMGRYIALGIIIYYIKIRNNMKSKKIKFSYFLIMFILLIGIMMVNSRGPILSLFVSVFLYEIIQIRPSVKKFLRIILFLIPISLFITYILLYSNGRFNLTYLLNDKNIMDRLDFINNSISMFKNKPLTGYGIGSFPVFYAGTTDRIYPHNIILELMSETGLIGSVIFLVLLFKVYKIDKNDYFNLNIITIFTFFLINSMFSGDIFNNYTVFIFMIIVLIQKKNVSAKENKYGYD